MSAEKRVIDVIIELVGNQPPVTIDSTRETLELDSLDEVELLMMLELEFGTEISDDVASQWQTVSDIVKFFDGKGQQA